MKIFLYKIIFFALSFFICSCFKYESELELTKNIMQSSLEIGKDIRISSNDNISLIEPRIYKENGQYYFGNFYYVDGNSVYFIDAPSSNLNMISNNNIKTILANYNNISNASIMNVDKDSIYITHLSTIYFEDNVQTNEIIRIESPDIGESYFDGVYSSTNIITHTNYTGLNVISLSKISKEGEILLTLQNILDEDATILKIITTGSNFFIVYRKDYIMLDEYTEEGSYITTYKLNKMEEHNEEKNEYKRIIDIVYLKSEKKMAVMTETLLNGEVFNREVFITSDFKTIEKRYTIEDINNSQILALKEDGIIAGLYFENNKYMLSKYDIYTKKKSLTDIGMDYVLGMGSFDVFGGDVVSFNLSNDIITFYKY